ncbi:hypothetical protein CVT26_007017 [Gymnopilus dilepis]|uniref:Uncharacterized protein n=1 Tax=Gymnopilus dilepis TaxID=231916 RepID=A0A409W038_9AGAR|nr:hypothetical protein CVT26_007017 [Gymnopilus dilepis]
MPMVRITTTAERKPMPMVRITTVVERKSMSTERTATTPEPLPGVVPPSSELHAQAIIISTSILSCVLIIACIIYYFLKWKKQGRKPSTGVSSPIKELAIEPFISPRTTTIDRQTAGPPLPHPPRQTASIRALRKLARLGRAPASQPVPSAPMSTTDNSSTTANLEQQIRSLQDMMQQVTATVARIETSNMKALGNTPSEAPPPDYADSRSGI